jgi:hypothetical protein
VEERGGTVVPSVSLMNSSTKKWGLFGTLAIGLVQLVVNTIPGLEGLQNAANKLSELIALLAAGGITIGLRNALGNTHWLDSLTKKSVLVGLLVGILRLAVQTFPALSGLEGAVDLIAKILGGGAVVGATFGLRNAVQRAL